MKVYQWIRAIALVAVVAVPVAAWASNQLSNNAGSCGCGDKCEKCTCGDKCACEH